MSLASPLSCEKPLHTPLPIPPATGQSSPQGNSPYSRCPIAGCRAADNRQGQPFPCTKQRPKSPLLSEPQERSQLQHCWINIAPLGHPCKALVPRCQWEMAIQFQVFSAEGS